MVIDPTQEYAIVELHRIKWFLGNIDLTKNENAGEEIQNAYNNIRSAIAFLQSKRKSKNV